MTSPVVMEESVCVKLPDGSRYIATVAVQASEDDRDIALRLARTFPIGSILSIAGDKWRLDASKPPKVSFIGSNLESSGESYLPPDDDANEEEPVEVKEQIAPAISVSAAPPQRFESEALSQKLALEILPGQQWRPKDPRRKSAFTVERVENGTVYTSDGRTVQQNRMSRYQLVTA